MRSRHAPMPDKTCNEVVRFVLARTGAEAARVIESLPDAAQKGLAADLKACGEAYRFDLSKESAYYFERKDTGVIMWSWRHLCSYDEIGDLLSLVATLDGPITEEVANTLYTRATLRSVATPQRARPELEINNADLQSSALPTDFNHSGHSITLTA